MGDSVSPALAILAWPGSAPTKFPILRLVSPSSGVVGIDTKQYSVTRLPNSQIEEFGEFGQVSTSDLSAQFTWTRDTSGFDVMGGVRFD